MILSETFGLDLCLHKHSAASAIRRHIEDINAFTVPPSISLYDVRKVTVEQDVAL